LLDICRRHGFQAGASVVEIGCGTGRISVGLAMQPDVGHLFITDPSPAFCRIVQKKLAGMPLEAAHVDFGILAAEDVGALPAGSVSMILLRSVLHHIADVPGFLRASAAALTEGGILVCEEPYYEGYMMMGFMAQFIEAALAASGYVISTEERERVAFFVATMQFYCRRDIDKSSEEDKHLFRPDELMTSGRELGLELTHYPNRRITDSEKVYIGTHRGYYQRFFAAYIRYCMDWPQEFSARVEAATLPYFEFFRPLEHGGNTTPACFGTFVFVRV
jgi:SAM-dependent methyltransferase